MSNTKKNPDCGQKCPLAAPDKINYFARKWLWKFSERYPDIGEVTFSNECFALGFGTDLGKSFKNAFPKNDMQSPAGLREVINEINDVFFLGTVIFSYWRYQTHGAVMPIYNDESREWMQTAFRRLIAITNPAECDFWTEEEFWGKSDAEKKACSFVKLNDGPIVDAKKYKEQIPVAGTFRIRDGWKVIKNLTTGEIVLLIREPDNKFDENAIRVETRDTKIKLGYIPRKIAAVLAMEMDRGFIYIGYITDRDADSLKINIDVSRREILPIDKVTSIELEESAAMAPWSAVTTINFRQKKFIRREMSFAEIKVTELKFTDKSWKEFSYPELQRCNFLHWKDDIFDECICDGLAWKLTVRCGKGSVIKVENNGMNYPLPLEWDRLQDYFKECLNLDNMKGSGKFYIITPKI